MDNSKARSILLQANDFILEDGLLYRMVHHPGRRNTPQLIIKQLCVPTSCRPQIAIGLHDNNSHIGVVRLFATCKSRFLFPNMYNFLKSHVLTCLTCQKTHGGGPQGPAPPISLPVSRPGSRWHIDFHGSFPISDGYRYVLVAIDSTSMWVELIPTINCTAETTINSLFTHVFFKVRPS